MKPQAFSVGNGMTLYCITTDRFKGEYLSMQFYLPLQEQSAQELSLVPVVLRRASARYPDKQALNRRLDELYSTAIGIKNRRLGDMHNIGFSVDFLGERYAGKGLLSDVIELLAELLFAPALQSGLLLESVVESEKENLRDAIRAAVNDPRALALSHCRKLLCPNEPYAISLLGKENDVGRINAASLTQRYHELIKGSKPVFFYVGATPPERVAELLSQHFSRFEGSLPVYCTHHAVQKGALAEQEKEMPLCQGKLAIGFRTDVSICHPLAPATVLMNEIFGGSPASKLFLNVREKRSLCYHCSSSLDLYKGVLFAQSGMKSENRRITQEAIFEEFRALQEGNITAHELEAARGSLKHVYTQLFDNAAALADFYLNRALAGSTETVDQWRDRIAAVELGEIVEAARHVAPGAIFFLNGTLEEEGEE